MVKIRLARFGKKKQPIYRVVAMNARSKRNGEVLEYLGTYDPKTNPSTIELDTNRIQYWLDNGAQPTYTVKSLFVMTGFKKADIAKRPPQKKEEKKAEKKEVVKKDETKVEKDKEAKPEEEQPTPKKDNQDKTKAETETNEDKQPKVDKE